MTARTLQILTKAHSVSEVQDDRQCGLHQRMEESTPILRTDHYNKQMAQFRAAWDQQVGVQELLPQDTGTTVCLSSSPEHHHKFKDLHWAIIGSTFMQSHSGGPGRKIDKKFGLHEYQASLHHRLQLWSKEKKGRMHIVSVRRNGIHVCACARAPPPHTHTSYQSVLF